MHLTDARNEERRTEIARATLGLPGVNGSRRVREDSCYIPEPVVTWALSAAKSSRMPPRTREAKPKFN